jgi:hypothetical protein
MESWSAGGDLLDLRAVGALAADAEVMRRTGTVRVAASLAGRPGRVRIRVALEACSCDTAWRAYAYFRPFVTPHTGNAELGADLAK